LRRRIFSSTILFILAIFTLIPPLAGFGATPPPVLALNAPPVPGADLNATGFSINYQWDSVQAQGNSSRVDVIVQEVNASDIGPCEAGDLSLHTFTVYNNTGDTRVFTDNLEYNGSMWVAINYSLIQHTNMTVGVYYIICNFTHAVQGWTTSTNPSPTFTYTHTITISEPTFTYIADTSYTIDIFVDEIRSSIWGALTETSSNYIIFQETLNASAITQFINELTYNSTSEQWERDELNISSLTGETEYTIKVTATYGLTFPLHTGSGSPSVPFTYLSPYLVITIPDITYIGREFQLLNISVASVWDSVNGYLVLDNITMANFTIFEVATNQEVVNGTLLYNATGDFWYFWNLNLTDYIPATMSIGESYNVTAYFLANETFNRPSINQTSQASDPFLLDRDPPAVVQNFINPDPPTDEDSVDVTFEISDDALIHTVILSYFNGSSWVNVTMRGTRSKLANFTATIPEFPERTVISYRVFINDSQNTWINSTEYSYTVADTPPLIAHLIITPTIRTDADIIIIYANVSDGTAVGTVTLHYSFDGIQYTSVSMTHIAGNQYSGEIPPFGSGRLASFQFETVFFQIKAEDVYGNLRETALHAYLVQGTAVGIDPTLLLLAISVIAMTVVILIILFKIYEQY
jgi:hypothetical protein